MGWETQYNWIESKVSKVASVSWSNMKKHIFKTIPGLTPNSSIASLIFSAKPASYTRVWKQNWCSQSTKAVLIKSYLNADKLCILLVYSPSGSLVVARGWRQSQGEIGAAPPYNLVANSLQWRSKRYPLVCKFVSQQTPEPSRNFETNNWYHWQNFHIA